MSTKAQQNRDRVAQHAQRQRAAGLVRRYKWVHPEDWPRVDALVKELNAAREKQDEK